MAGKDVIGVNLKKRLLGVLLPILLVAVSICLGLILTSFVIGEKGSAKNQPQFFSAESVLAVEPSGALAYAVMSDSGSTVDSGDGSGKESGEASGNGFGEAFGKSSVKAPALFGQAEATGRADLNSASVQHHEAPQAFASLGSEFSVSEDKDVLLAEVDPIDQLLSTPSPYDNLTGVSKERAKPKVRGQQQKAPGSGKSVSPARAVAPKAEVSSPATDKESKREGAGEVADDSGDDASADEAKSPQGENDGSQKPEQGVQRGQASGQASGANSAGGKSKKTPVHLFNTVSLFPKPVSSKTAPQWYRVVKTQSTPPPIFSNGTAKRMPPNVAKRWFALREKIESSDDFAKAKAVNTFFNTWPYRTDDVVWGVPEYWATPEEFLEKSGDCEDYAITKYYAMRSLGVSADKLRVVAVKDTIRGIGHAVLTIFINDTAYVLDNLSPYVLEHTVLKNYKPQFSVNEHYRWGHARIVKKK